MLALLQYRWTVFYLLLLSLGALLLFMYGFFPLKYNSGKFAQMDDLPNFIDGVSIDGHQVYNAGDNTVILMVIDGLRYDFVTEEYMPYTGQLLKNKTACIYVSVAEPPTVTMPRIKAMMTGSVSTFADVALNFGAPAVRGDSVLRVAKSRGRRSVIYGDDTWLRLFPGLWSEADGTTSFYVTDYTEVDNNVTRHLDKILAPDERKKPNFDFLVLHYLGLDHIGHLEGARSEKIKPKLIEMDSIIQKIYAAMKKWDRPGVLFICGDHGMRDAGGHGGSSPAEVLVPLVVAKSDDFTCPHPVGPGPTVAQVDLAPTIAWLLNAPIPGDSTGRVLPSLLPSDVREHLYLLHVVASHNARLPSMPTNKEFYMQYLRAEKQFAHYLATGEQSAAKIAKDFYEESLEEMAKVLTQSTVDFDMFAIGVAILLLYCTGISLLCITLYSLQPELSRRPSTMQTLRQSRAGTMVAVFVIYAICAISLILTCFITETKSQLCSFEIFWIIPLILVAFAFTYTYFITKTAIERTKDMSALRDLNVIDYLLIGGTIFHTWSFFGTSFIEEEHMTWYFYWNTLMFFILIRTIVVVVLYFGKAIAGATEVMEKGELAYRMVSVGIDILPKWIFLITLHRFLRTMNQTGDRWLFLPDTADWLNEPQNRIYLELIVFISITATTAICIRNLIHVNNFKYVHTVLTIVTAGSILAYKYVVGQVGDGTEFPEISFWDHVDVVSFFWKIIAVQFAFELITYLGIFRSCANSISKKFTYRKPKEKREDYFYDQMEEEPWNLEEVKLNLARSISYLMLNSMMLIITLLMRPHNMIMVPSVYFTCFLTHKCLDHKLLDPKPSQVVASTKNGKHKILTSNVRNTEIADTLSQTLGHLWIGYVFYFYQGNSNSLASVDLQAGYVGLREYSEVPVAMRMGLHAYAGPALAGASLFCSLADHAHTWTQYLDSVWRACNIVAFQRVYSVAIYCVVAAVFRHHLFVWTVFSPKLLYDFVATVFTTHALATIASVIIITHVTSWLAKTITYKTVL